MDLFFVLSMINSLKCPYRCLLNWFLITLLMCNIAYLYRIELWLRTQSMKNSGKGMWKNQFDREMRNPLWRKLCCRYQTGVSHSRISKCRRSCEGEASSVGSSLCSVGIRRNTQVFSAQFTCGRSVISLFFLYFQLVTAQAFPFNHLRIVYLLIL